MVSLCKQAVDSGYWKLFRYDPRKKDSNPFQLDSDIVEPVEPFLLRQGRYKILQTKRPEEAKLLFQELQHEIIRKHKYQQMLASSGSAVAAETPDFLKEQKQVPRSIASAAVPVPSDSANSKSAFLHRATVHTGPGSRVKKNLVAKEVVPQPRKLVEFSFGGKSLQGFEGEMISVGSLSQYSRFLFFSSSLL